MRSMAFYDKLSELNDSLYNGAKDFQDWKLLDTYNGSMGLFIALYDIDNKETLLAVKGSENGWDYIEDIKLWISKTNEQAKDASRYYESIKDKYPNIIFTGYSLGASIVQILNGQYGNESIAFEPYGTYQGRNNLINFGNIYDPIFMQNPDGHRGDIYIMPVQRPFAGRKELWNTHLPGKYGKPSEAKKLNGQLKSNPECIKGFSRTRDLKHKIEDKTSQYIRDGIVTTKNAYNKFEKQSKDILSKYLIK